MKRRKNRKNRKNNQNPNQPAIIQLKVEKQIKTICSEAAGCPYSSTCPKCKNRICNANSLCCKTCSNGDMCPMRRIV